MSDTASSSFATKSSPGGGSSICPRARSVVRPDRVRFMPIPKSSRFVVSWIRYGSEPSGRSICLFKATISAIHNWLSFALFPHSPQIVHGIHLSAIRFKVWMFGTLSVPAFFRGDAISQSQASPRHSIPWRRSLLHSAAFEEQVRLDAYRPSLGPAHWNKCRPAQLS
jgi:hypothetical protein